MKAEGLFVCFCDAAHSIKNARTLVVADHYSLVCSRVAAFFRLWTFASLLSQPFGSNMPNFVGRVTRLVWLSSIPP
ncbi:MAG: hypothetical protein IJM92_06365 [Fibrobacter sp.]|uniref:hypothetical protein n=1 Tax=Fibrobacter sp. TaxID=35828 RepID=UPI0025BEB3A8|nr:hypothetical protein [Fibrobacter sp.]MBQ7079278.1 hypothetical protein [Fibrobacter sp.]